MKLCGTCGLWKNEEEEEFAWRFKDRGIRQNSCKLCQYAYQKELYQRNKETHKSATTAHKKKYSEENFEHLIAYLTNHPCVDC